VDELFHHDARRTPLSLESDGSGQRCPRKVLTQQARPPLQLVTDKLRSYPAAQREVFPSITHRTGR
jgi:hypothetical protein